jgi:hypothetical protein
MRLWSLFQVRYILIYYEFHKELEMREHLIGVLIAGTALSSAAFAEPGTRDRLPPSQSVAEDVQPTGPNTPDRSNDELVPGPHAYGEPSDKPGKERLGNSETPGREGGNSNN